MSIHAERILGLQRLDVGTQVEGGELISTVTLGSDFSIFNCCT